MMLILEAFLVAMQLTADLARHQIDAGVEVLTAFLGPDHQPVRVHRHLRGLLRNAGVARHGQMDIGLLDHPLEVVDGPRQLGFGVFPDRRGDVEIAAVDQQFHQAGIASWVRIHPG